MDFENGGNGLLRYQGTLCIPNIDGLQEKILSKAHQSRYRVYSRSTMLYHDLKEIYWWKT